MHYYVDLLLDLSSLALINKSINDFKCEIVKRILKHVLRILIYIIC